MLQVLHSVQAVSWGPRSMFAVWYTVIGAQDKGGIWDLVSTEADRQVYQNVLKQREVQFKG